MVATISILAFLTAVLLAVSAGWLALRRAGKKAKRQAFYAILAFILSLATAWGNLTGEQPPSPANQARPPVAQTASPPPGTAPDTSTSQEKPPGASNQPAASGKLRVHYLDVGQGDAILVQMPDGKNILIDGGTSDAGPDVVQKLKQYGVEILDFVIGTHPHEDHIGGLDLVINSFPVGKVYLPRVTHNTDSYRDLLLAIKNKGLKATEAKAGVALPLEGSIQALFVSPARKTYEDLNDYSAVLHLTYGQTAFLFTGDAGTTVEEEMLAGGKPLKADVLKVAHHGSRYSTSTAFLKAVAPWYAVISVGKGNDYSHPHAQTLQRLQKAGVKIYRTDRDGTITALSDGQKVTIQ
ncbi:Metallo-beta-lactamase superfamily protein [Neomoorella glycerini]|uniref:Metallo-beta-lactamase superfamily protein n=1 Tax=Neomoorella glycerini TaxID=55779 RepID=A0A6I5ZWA4_9FIRM|nr:ComEC/Rec2 family competence protein [Moorella glycerini]QGP93621.1 Metallo-beta-lactamase superfamily protein [Moorella glycerini]